MSVVELALLPNEAPLVLDTPVWLATATGRVRGLDPALLPVVEEAARARRLHVSTGSALELMGKVEQGVLNLGNPYVWFSNQNRPPGVTMHYVTTEIAVDASLLPRWIRSADGQPHHDIYDRFIVATARRVSAALVTADPVLLDYADQGHVDAIDARIPGDRVEIGNLL